MIITTTRHEPDHRVCCDAVLPADREDILCDPCWQECAGGSRGARRNRNWRRMQLTLPTLPAPHARPRRRVLWREEMIRLHQLHADARYRDRQEHNAAMARRSGELADMRARLLDIERHAGIADLRVPPRTRPQSAGMGAMRTQFRSPPRAWRPPRTSRKELS
jgi:hypothetical protein